MQKKKKKMGKILFFLEKKVFSAFYGQRSVTAAWATAAWATRTDLE